MPLCVAAGALALTLAAESFTLAWTHSIEKIRWEEDWRIAAGKLHLHEARVRGSGAGMEPPQGAVLRAGVWHYHPGREPVDELLLAHSPYAAPYELCLPGKCAPLDRWLEGLAGTATISLRPCPTR